MMDIVLISVGFILGFFVGGEVRMWVHSLAKKHADRDYGHRCTGEHDCKGCEDYLKEPK